MLVLIQHGIYTQSTNHACNVHTQTCHSSTGVFLRQTKRICIILSPKDDGRSMDELVVNICVCVCMSVWCIVNAHIEKPLHFTSCAFILPIKSAHDDSACENTLSWTNDRVRKGNLSVRVMPPASFLSKGPAYLRTDNTIVTSSSVVVRLRGIHLLCVIMVVARRCLNTPEARVTCMH